VSNASAVPLESEVDAQAEEEWWRANNDDNATVIQLSGKLDIDRAPRLWAKVNALLEGTPAPKIVMDVSELESMDSACVAIIVHLQRQFEKRKLKLELRGANPELQKLYALHVRKRRHRRKDRKPRGTLAQLGQASVNLWVGFRDVCAFIGELCVTVVREGFSLRRYNLRDAALTAERAGADAVPIVLLVNFLVGFVMAYQSARQLERFGANILVADLVGIAVVRELAPLMTAIVVCGRSGAAFAAELGTMKVGEEVDALRTLGMHPIQYLVMPRMLGLMAVAPILTLIADGIGIFGGVVVGATKLGVSPQGFLSEMSQAVTITDVVSGLVKSVAFAAACAIIACERGLSVTGGAAEVGQRTTSAVVTILFSLIVLDAIFTVLMETLLL
jgi:phospholipid/cholesterol/gamma-HCH transport system permease protein